MSISGGVLFAEINKVACAVVLELSRTVVVTVNEVGSQVGAVKVWSGVSFVRIAEPSPKSQRYVRGNPSGSVDALPSNWTASRLGPKNWSAVATARGVSLAPTP